MSGLEIAGLFSTLTENPVRDPIQLQRLLDVRQRAARIGRCCPEPGIEQWHRIAASELPGHGRGRASCCMGCSRASGIA